MKLLMMSPLILLLPLMMTLIWRCKQIYPIWMKSSLMIFWEKWNQRKRNDKKLLMVKYSLSTPYISLPIPISLSFSPKLLLSVSLFFVFSLLSFTFPPLLLFYLLLYLLPLSYNFCLVFLSHLVFLIIREKKIYFVF